MRAIALLGGPKEEWPQSLADKIRLAQKKGALTMASDRGSLLLLELGIVPDVALGDYDSLTNHERQSVERKVKDMRYSNPTKDFTGSEMSYYVTFIDYKVNNLTIYGETGGGLDHFFVDMYVVLRTPLAGFKEQIKFVDKQSIACFFDKGRRLVSYNSDYKYLGIGTLTEVKDFSIKNAKYDLVPVDSKVPTIYSSNGYLHQQAIKISCKFGVSIVINSRDKE